MRVGSINRGVNRLYIKINNHCPSSKPLDTYILVQTVGYTPRA